MELNGIVESLQDKSILITGSSGFLAKVFVEKVLRVQPNVKRLFLVLRAADTKSASQRMHKEVFGKELFKVLKGFQMGETLNGTPGLDIEQERKLVEETLDQLKFQNATREEEALAMKELGQTRARYYGWPNTYVFTKSMGEMIIGQLREKLPIVILRPTIITSTYKEPFPGWVEGVRTIDSFAVAYGKGKLKSILGGTDSVLDLLYFEIPAQARIDVRR